MGDDFNDVWRLDVASVSLKMSGACLRVDIVSWRMSEACLCVG